VSTLVKKEIVAERLEKLKEYLAVLKTVGRYDLPRFLEDPIIHGAAERYLQLAIECVLDIGNHIISDRNFRKPGTYGEIFEILAENNIISTKLLTALEGMAAFRNILVHDYVRLDRDRVYQLIHTRLKYIEQLAKIYAGLIKKDSR
jgi:uncharacterized protein YutE (UPF0331/DUF86 family)